MKAIRVLTLIGLGFGMSACGPGDAVTRGAMPPSALSVATKSAAPVVAMTAQYDVQDIRVSVPQSLRVSEANMFYPVADIVWRGDPRGDRHAQVKGIIEDGLRAGVQGMHAGPKVVADVEVVRFHSLTEKTRFTVGGVHSVKFDLTLRDAETGAVLEGPRRIVADVKGAGGARAIAEEQAGRTMRVVITEHLAQVIRRELSAPMSDAELAAMARGGNAAALVTLAAQY